MCLCTKQHLRVLGLLGAQGAMLDRIPSRVSIVLLGDLEGDDWEEQPS